MLPGLCASLLLAGARKRTYRYIKGLSATQTSYTDTAVPIGPASGDRIVIVGVAGRGSSSGRTLNTVTIGGVSATVVGKVVNTTGGYATVSAFAIARVPAADVPGDTADIVVTYNGAMLRSGIGVWTIEGASSETPLTASGDTSDPHTASLNVKNEGWAFGFGMDYNNTGSLTWTGLTQDAQVAVTGDTQFKVYAASKAITADAAAYAVQATSGGAGSFPSFSFLSMF